MKKIEAMHYLHGITKGEKCGDCCNFIRLNYHDYTYRKCKAYGVTASEASDWLVRYAACGLFNVPFNKETMRKGMEVARGINRKAEEVPLDGQVKWEI